MSSAQSYMNLRSGRRSGIAAIPFLTVSDISEVKYNRIIKGRLVFYEGNTSRAFFYVCACMCVGGGEGVCVRGLCVCGCKIDR